MIFAIWLIKKVVKNTEKIKWKIFNGTSVAIIFVLILFGDSITGRIYLNYLCETEGGAHIYQTVELGPEYWNEDGSKKFIYPKGHKKYGGFNGVLEGRYDSSTEAHEYFFNVVKKIRNINDTETGEIMAEYNKFYFHNGWVVNSVGYPFQGLSCPETQEIYMHLLNSVFAK